MEFFNISVSLEDLKEQVDYDPATGLFRRKVSLCHRVKVGDIAGCFQNKGYISISILGKAFLAHRLAWYIYYGEVPNGIIDHINGDRSDNKIENLRIVSRSENVYNSKTKRKKYTKFRGVSFKNNRWGGYFVVNIKFNKENIYLGKFDDEIEAYKTYLLKAKELFGDYMHDSLNRDYIKYIVNKET